MIKLIKFYNKVVFMKKRIGAETYRCGFDLF